MANERKTSFGSDQMTVQVQESDYAKKWRLEAGISYNLAVSSSCIMLYDTFSSSMIVIPRGLIKNIGRDSNKRNCALVQIIHESAHGQGELALFVSDSNSNADLAHWVLDRLFPKKSTLIWASLCKWMSRLSSAISSVVSNVFCCKCLRRKHRATSEFDLKEDPMTAVVVEPRESRTNRDSEISIPSQSTSRPSSTKDQNEQSSSSQNLFRKQFGPKSASTESIKGSQEQVLSGLTRAHTVKVRRKDSFQRLKSGVRKMMVSLRQDKHPEFDRSIPSYRSFENIDDCFNFDDDFDKDFKDESKDGSVLASSNYDFGFDHDEEPYEKPSSISEPGDLDCSRVGDAKEAWYKQTMVFKEYDPSTMIPVGFDDQDDTVIVMDSMDIFKVPRSSVSSDLGSESKEDREDKPFKTEICIQVDPPSDFTTEISSSSSTSEDIITPMTEIESEIHANQRQTPQTSSASSASEGYDKCEDIETAASAESVNKRSISDEVLIKRHEEDDDESSEKRHKKYVENSKSLVNLKTASVVRGALAKLELKEKEQD